jgi:PAS domain S-box-containing protein
MIRWIRSYQFSIGSFFSHSTQDRDYYFPERVDWIVHTWPYIVSKAIIYRKLLMSDISNALVVEIDLPTRVLVVEDEPQMAKFITFKLNYLGYEVVGIATNEAMAIQLAKDLKPDLILMDILLDNDDDGIETANKILAFADVPIVYLTAQEDDEIFQRAKITKPFGYLLKPFNDRDLNLVIETATYRQKQKSELAGALEDARSIIDSSFLMIITLNNADNIKEFNRAAQWVLGYSHEEVYGKSVLDYLINADDLSLIKTTITRGRRSQLEIEFKQKDGHSLACLLSLSTLRNSQDNSTGILMISH